MSLVCGVMGRRASAGAKEDVAAMLDATAGAMEAGLDLRRRSWWDDGVGLGVLAIAPRTGTDGNAPPGDPPGWAAAEGLALTGDLRLDDRDDLARRLDLAPDHPARGSDAALLLRAYRAWGDDCILHLRGDFAFALWDGTRNRLVCARDPMGVKPFYYHDGPGGFAFASRMSAVVALPWVPRTVDEVWVADLLCRFMIDRDRTLCEAVRGLDAGHVMVVGPEGVRRHRYWAPEAVAELRLPSDDAWVEAYREALVRAVRRRTGPPEPPFGEVGAELSGGLDSSGISAIAHRLLAGEGRTLHTFAHVHPPGVEDVLLPPDGKASVERVIGHTGIAGTCFLTGEEGGILPALDWALRHYDQPPRLTQSFYNDREYAAAKARDVGAILSGFGGNQGVSNEGMGVPEALMWRGEWRRLAAEVPSLGGRGIARLLLGAASRVSGPLLPRRARRGQALFDRKLRYRAIDDGLAARVDVPARARAYLALLDYRDLVTRGRGPQGVPARRLQAPDVSRRLEHEHMATSVRGMAYRYPMLDVDLVELFLAMPPWMMRRRGRGRHVFRRSLEGWLPDQVRRAPARASANPGSLLRCRRDREEMWARLRDLTPDNPVFAYVDLEKLAVSFDLKWGDGTRPWERDTHLIQVLVLEGKLRALG